MQLAYKGVDMAAVEKDYWKKTLTEIEKGWKELRKKTLELGKQAKSGKAWELTKKKLAQTGKFIGKQAKAGTEFSKLKFKEFTLNQDKNRLLAEVGKKTVQLYRQRKITDPGLKEMCEKLDPKEKELRQVKRQLSSLRKTQKS